MRKEIWTEKYRPRKLDEVVGQDEVIERLKSYVEQGTIPHLLFSGPPGVGKTAAAVAISRELFGDKWSGNFRELNASDERGIDTVRNSIKNFARISPIGNSDFKIIFLDESDSLTPDAQSALRRTMERYSNTCRFILSCNYSSKIIEPIQSRCAVFRFKPLTDEAIRKRIEYIASMEGIEITNGAIDAIVYIARGDMRRAINALQSAAVFGKRIEPDDVYQITASPHPEAIRELIDLSLKGEFIKARIKLNSLIDEGISEEDILFGIHREVFNLDIPDRMKVALIDRIGEIDFRLTEGANGRIQLEALIAYLVLGSE
ncbi:MAG: replication factor C small subunit [Candidatus Syntropharchaeia archaeon]